MDAIAGGMALPTPLTSTRMPWASWSALTPGTKRPSSIRGTNSLPWVTDCRSRIKAPFAEGPRCGSCVRGVGVAGGGRSTPGLERRSSSLPSLRKPRSDRRGSGGGSTLLCNGWPTSLRRDHEPQEARQRGRRVGSPDEGPGLPAGAMPPLWHGRSPSRSSSTGLTMGCPSRPWQSSSACPSPSSPAWNGATATWETLARLARTMDVEFLVEVHPTAGPRLRQVS